MIPTGRFYSSARGGDRRHLAGHDRLVGLEPVAPAVPGHLQREVRQLGLHAQSNRRVLGGWAVVFRLPPLATLTKPPLLLGMVGMHVTVELVHQGALRWCRPESG